MIFVSAVFAYLFFHYYIKENNKLYLILCLVNLCTFILNMVVFLREVLK